MTADSSGSRLSLVAQEVAQARQDPRRVLGQRFVLLSQLGQGGMGVVWRAWDERLRRIVALKMILAERTDATSIERFRREAEAVTRLRHPNIVSVHDVGDVGGRPYIAMDFIEGRNLEGRLGPRTDEGERIPLTTALAIVRDVARGLHHAHQQGVVHRDFKPANVMLDANGHPYVMDFGLARLADSDSKLTKTGAMAMGTAAYMPPEQADGRAKTTDGRGDVWSLGATLYEVLTGRPPFVGETNLQVITQVLGVDPVPPSSINRRASGDLETICLRCLEKEPDRRYPTAAELADDLDRWLAGEPIAARPVGPLARLVRRARRHKVATVLAAVATVTTLGGGAVAVREAAGRRRAEREKNEALGRALGETRAALAKAEEQRQEAQRSRELAFRMLALAAHEKTLRHLRDGDHRIAAALAARALAWDDALLHRSTLLLAQDGLWRAPRALTGHEGAATAVAFSPDGGLLASAGVDGTVRLWSTTTGEERLRSPSTGVGVHALAFTADGRFVFCGGATGEGRVLDASEGRVAARLPHQGGIFTFALSPDGRRMASACGDGGLRLFDAASFELVAGFAHEYALGGLAFEPSGERLAVGGGDGKVRFHDAATLAPVTTLAAHKTPVYDLDFAPDGKRLATLAEDGLVRLWDPQTRKDVGKMTWDKAASLAYSPDGRWLVGGAGDGTVHVFDLPLNRTLGRAVDHRGTVLAVAFDRANRRLATAGNDGKVNLYELGAAGTIEVPHRSGIFGVAWSPDGKLLASVGTQGAFKVSDARGHEVSTPRFPASGLRAVAFAGDGRLATGDREGRVVLWEGAGHITSRSLAARSGEVFSVAFSKDGRLAAGGEDRKACVYAASEATLELEHGGSVLSVAWSPDGKLLATGCADRTVRIFEGSRVARAFAGHEGGVAQVAFSPDGTRLATCGADGLVRLWTASGDALAKLEGHRGAALSLAWSPDGKLLASSAEDGIRLWTGEGKPLGQVAWPQVRVNVLAFSPSGDALAAGGGWNAGHARIWPLAALLEGKAADALHREVEGATGLTVREGSLEPELLLR